MMGAGGTLPAGRGADVLVSAGDKDEIAVARKTGIAPLI